MERTTYLQEDQGNRNYQNSSILNLKTFCNVDVENNARAVIVVSCYSIKKKKKWKMEVSLTSIRECCILFFVSSWPIIIFRIFLWKMATAISRIEKRQLKGKRKKKKYSYCLQYIPKLSAIYTLMFTGDDTAGWHGRRGVHCPISQI